MLGAGKRRCRVGRLGLEEGDSDGFETPAKLKVEQPTTTSPILNPRRIVEEPRRSDGTTEEPSPIRNVGARTCRTRLKPAEEVILLRLCFQHKELYNGLSKTTFWTTIKKKIKEVAGKSFSNPDGRIKVLLRRREIERQELKERGRLRIDKVGLRYKQWLDKWQQWLDEVEGQRNRRTRDNNEAEYITSSSNPRTLAAPSANLIQHEQVPEEPQSDYTKAVKQLICHTNLDKDITNLLLRVELKYLQDMEIRNEKLDEVTKVVSILVKERDEMRNSLMGCRRLLPHDFLGVE
ncbi:MAG: hypothetical protein M1830_000580 [Pleopsidium flavum]|nr:MAG: hypothetical protein M1830_000580 [Pleopsidium flavum]